MNTQIEDVIYRYAKGKISAMQAASELGGDTTGADVIVMLRQLGLSPPLPPPEQQAAELAHARRVMGFDAADE